MIKQIKKRLSAINLPTFLTKPIGLGKILWNDIQQTKLMLHASSMCYMSLGSIVPSLAVIFSIIAIFQPLTDPDANWFGMLRDYILANLTPEAGQEMVLYMQQFLEQLDVTRIGITGFGFLFVIIILLLRNIEIALNNVWQVSDERSPFKRFLYFWITITLGALSLSIVLPLLAQVDTIANWIPFMERTPDEEANPFTSITTFIITLLFFTILHKAGPNCNVSFKAAVVGGLTATILIRLASRGFTIYLQRSDWYEDIYGALAVVPLFLLWLFIGWLIILFSAIIAWRTQHGLQVKREADVEAPSPSRETASLTAGFQIRSILPVVSTLMACERFREGNGQGISAHEISIELEIPPLWVKQSILAAEQAGLLVIERPKDLSQDSFEDILNLRTYPSFPLEKMQVSTLLEKLSHEAQDWLLSQKNSEAMNVYQICESIFRSLQENNGHLTIELLLAKSPARHGGAA